MFKEVLEEMSTRFPNIEINQEDLINILNNNSKSNLIIFVCHSNDAMRDFVYDLGYELYNARNRVGKVFPQTTFIFDEADEFIPQKIEKKSSYARSTKIAEHVARRGRKFKLGIGLSTQRVGYLNTNILAQMHSFFISRLPRKYDRDVISDAFMISVEELKQTFGFRIGQWLLVSHNATGLKNIPIPVDIENANNRVKEFLLQK